MVMMHISILFLTGVLATPAPVDRGHDPVVVVAGVPQSLGATRNYDLIFFRLAEAGIDAFFPTFQTAELPAPSGLGFETDFLPPCTPEDPAFVALRQHDIGLVVPGELLYAGGEIPEMESDPLAELLECAGPAAVVAVTSVDEPALRDPEAAGQLVEALYRRVKTVAPSIPVLMVHAPFPAWVEGDTGGTRPVTPTEITRELGEIRMLSSWSDAAGFDVYPVPPEVAGLALPDASLATDPEATVAAYLSESRSWDRPLDSLLVMQGFGYADLLDGAVDVAPPERHEIEAMLCAATRGGARWLIWWGQGLLDSETDEPWPAVISSRCPDPIPPSGERRR